MAALYINQVTGWMTVLVDRAMRKRKRKRGKKSHNHNGQPCCGPHEGLSLIPINVIKDACMPYHTAFADSQSKFGPGG